MLDEIAMEQKTDSVPAPFQGTPAVTERIPSRLENGGDALNEL